MGDYYINVPASSESYESPALFAADPTQEPASGGNGHIAVGGIYFHWDTAEGGFTNTGWWGADWGSTNGNIGPTAVFGTDEEVTAHLQSPGANLNECFAKWQERISNNPETVSWEVQAFYDALSDDSDFTRACATFNFVR